MKYQDMLPAFLCIETESIFFHKTTVHIPGHQQKKFMHQKACPQPGKPQLPVVALSMWAYISAERDALWFSELPGL